LIRNITEKLNDEKIRFSPEAENEFKRMYNSLNDLASHTIELLSDNSPDAVATAKNLSERLLSMLGESEAGHLARINNGECRPQVGILYLELIEEIRKITRHLENINDRAGMFYEKLPNAAR